MQWFVWLFLSRSLFKARSSSSQSKLNYFLELIIVGAFATYLNNSFHVTSFRPNQPPSNLKLSIIINLNIKSTSVLDIFILSLSLQTSLLLLLQLSLWASLLLGFEVSIIYRLNLWISNRVLVHLVDVLVGKLGHGLRHSTILLTGVQVILLLVLTKTSCIVPIVVLLLLLLGKLWVLTELLVLLLELLLAWDLLLVGGRVGLVECIDFVIGRVGIVNPLHL